MTERQAWKTIAEAFETKPEDRTDEQKRVTREGICNASAAMRNMKCITGALSGKIESIAMKATRGLKSHPHLCDLRTPEGDAIRAAFCREQARKL